MRLSTVALLVVFSYGAAEGNTVTETFANPDGTVLTTTVEPEARLVRYDFDFSALPYP